LSLDTEYKDIPPILSVTQTYPTFLLPDFSRLFVFSVHYFRFHGKMQIERHASSAASDNKLNFCFKSNTNPKKQRQRDFPASIN
jgi:hypothetical protein